MTKIATPKGSRIQKIALSAVAGFFIAGVLSFVALVIYFRVFEASEAPDIRSWQYFSATMGSLGIGLVGLIFGMIFAIVRLPKA